MFHVARPRAIHARGPLLASASIVDTVSVQMKEAMKAKVGAFIPKHLFHTSIDRFVPCKHVFIFMYIQMIYK